MEKIIENNPIKKQKCSFQLQLKSDPDFFILKSFHLIQFSLGNCQPQDVSLHLKAGSYPVISPENITFPKHFLSANQR
jgi:hypothetical protein